MNNPFFHAALKKSAVLAGKYSRILQLVVQLGNHFRNVDWSAVNHQGAKEKLILMARFAKAYAEGTYRSVSLKTVLMVLTVIIYFVNPMDLIPDLIPVAGLADDITV